MKKIIYIVVLCTLTNTWSQCFSTISPGAVHTVGLKPNGTIWGWGYADWGQLSTGISAFDEYLPIQLMPSSDWQFITAGALSTFAIKTNGTLWACGENLYGSLGLNNTINNGLSPFAQVGTATNWKKIAAGSSLVYGLRTDGTLWACGRNDNFQMGGYGTGGQNQATFVQIGTATDWKDVSTKSSFCVFALKNNGTLWGWGGSSVLLGGSSSIPKQIGTSSDWSQIAYGVSHILALKNNGDIHAWGSNTYGEIGLLTNSGLFPEFATVYPGPWSKIAAGFRTSFAIKPNGTLWAWGWNESGQLGQGTQDLNFHNVPVQVGTATNWVSVDANTAHIVALRADGSLWSWGRNVHGELGTGDLEYKSTPFNVPIAGCTLSTNEFSTNKVKIVVYPNPASQEVSVSYQGLEQVEIIELVDALGKVVFSTQALGNTNFKSTLVLPQLPSGNYLVLLKNKNQIIASEKLILK